MKHEPFDVLKFALDAYDTANTHAMRLWYASAFVSLPVLVSAAGMNPLPIEGFNIDVESALPPLLLILAALNLVFIVAQLSHYRMAYIYSSMVLEKDFRSEPVSSKYTWQDLLLSAPIAGHNRVMPIFETFGMNRNWRSTKALKSIVDILFGMFPAISLIVGTFMLPSSSPLYVVINVAAAVSLIASLPILWHAINWIKSFKDF